MQAIVKLLLTALLVSTVALGGCRQDPDAPVPARPTGASAPAETVLLLTGHLRNNDLAAFARDAVPPELAAPLETAWHAGRTRWPLEELPFDERIPGALGALAAADAESRLRLVFDQQFAGESTAITAAATTLGLFGAQYVRNEPAFSEGERTHYLQLVETVTRWAATASLSDPEPAHAAIGTLAKAARAARLPDEAAFAQAGMGASLARLSWVSTALKQVLAGYGLHLDDALSGMQAEQVSRDGDHAKVRMRYTLADQPIEAVVDVERVAGRWYLSDFLRHARAAAEPPEQPVEPEPAEQDAPAEAPLAAADPVAIPAIGPFAGMSLTA